MCIRDRVFVVRVLRYIVLIAEKGAHAAHLQNTFSSVHNCDFVLCHQLLSQFLILEPMRNLRAAIFGSVETVDCFTSQVDVYKRQVLCCVSRIRSLSKSRHSSVMDEMSPLRIPSRVAVSYTHLDVYKRQEHDSKLAPRLKGS